MKRKAFQLGMLFIIILGLTGTSLTVFFLNPYVSIHTLVENYLPIALLYSSLMLCFTGIFSLMLLWVKRKTASTENAEGVNMGVSFRQGLLLSVVLVIVLILQSLRILVWWDALLAVGAVMMIELYFLAR